MAPIHGQYFIPKTVANRFAGSECDFYFDSPGRAKIIGRREQVVLARGQRGTPDAPRRLLVARWRRDNEIAARLGDWVSAIQNGSR